MRKHSDQTMSLELMTHRLTYSVQWWQFSPSVFLLWIAAEKLFWSRFLVFRSCQMRRHSSVVAVGRAWQAAAVHIWRGRGQGEGTGNRPDWAGHCRWAGVSSTLATWSGRSTSSCNLEWVPRWGSWPTGCPHWRRWDLHPFGTLLLVQRGKMFFCDSAGSGVKILICRIRIQSKMDRIRNPGQKSFKC
jgi:hypothetical protein